MVCVGQSISLTNRKQIHFHWLFQNEGNIQFVQVSQKGFPKSKDLQDFPAPCLIC